MIVTKDVVESLRTMNNGFTGLVISTMSNYAGCDCSGGKWSRRIIGKDVPDAIMEMLFDHVSAFNTKSRLSEKKKDLERSNDQTTIFLKHFIFSTTESEDPYVVTSWIYSDKIDWKIVKEEIIKLPLKDLRETGYWKTLVQWKAVCNDRRCIKCGSSKNLNLRYADFKHHGSELFHTFQMELLCDDCIKRFSSSR